MREEEWKGKHFAYFSNRECEYFPCHSTQNPENFNCLFCYCPLYNIGDKCGGNFTILSNGVKDCSQCLLPHMRENYGYVLEKQAEIKR